MFCLRLKHKGCENGQIADIWDCHRNTGLTNKEIAEKANISSLKNTEKIRSGIMHKLDAKSPAQLGVIAEKYGLCRP